MREHWYAIFYRENHWIRHVLQKKLQKRYQKVKIIVEIKRSCISVIFAFFTKQPFPIFSDFSDSSLYFQSCSTSLVPDDPHDSCWLPSTISSGPGMTSLFSFYFLQKSYFVQTLHLAYLPGQTRALIGRLGTGITTCWKSAVINRVAALKPAPQFGHFTLTALIWQCRFIVNILAIQGGARRLNIHSTSE